MKGPAFFAADAAAQFLGIDVDQLLHFVPASFSPSPRNPRWSIEDLMSLACAIGECHVYVIRRPDAHEVKIGISTNPVRRLRDLQSNHARRLELVTAFPGTVTEEIELHTRFAAYRLRGEWFEEAREISAWLSKIPQFVPTAALKSDTHNSDARGVSICRTYSSLSVKSVVSRLRWRKRGLNGYPGISHLVHLSRLARGVPQGLPQQNDLWPAPLPDARERQDARNLAARQQLDAFVYGRPS